MVGKYIKNFNNSNLLGVLFGLMILILCHITTVSCLCRNCKCRKNRRQEAV